MKKHTINETFPNEQYLTVEKDGDDVYFPTYQDINEAVDSYDEKEGLVATYKLVKVEKLKLKRTTGVVKVK
ncbi:MAG: hypothetical protein LLG14_27415 [Nocardiaceae bacterium]|nr:hypothetical protein [Nocardiaceae bacterium]